MISMKRLTIYAKKVNNGNEWDDQLRRTARTRALENTRSFPFRQSMSYVKC